MSNHRNDLKELFQKYGIHRAIRSNTLNDLVDEINTYYVEGNTNCVTGETHKKHLKEQLNGWIDYLNNEANKLVGDSEYDKGVLKGYAEVIQKLEDVAKR